MFEQLSLRHGQRFSPFGNADRGTPLPLPRYVVWHKLADAARTIAAGFAERRRLHRCERELQNLDDRILKDIGFSRQSINSIVRHGREF